MNWNPALAKKLNDQWNDGTVMRPGVALTQLESDPRRFLQKYPIQQTFDSPLAGPIQAYFKNNTLMKDDKSQNFRPGAILGNLRTHRTEGFSIINAPMGPFGHPFWANNIPTTFSNVAEKWIALDSGGPALMITAKMTGCTFVARQGSAPGTVEVTHMQPTEESGLYLNARMSGPANSAYGRLRYNNEIRSVNVIGVRRSGTWKIYAQKVNRECTSVISVNRIWPA